jgi:hypothetical protein
VIIWPCNNDQPRLWSTRFWESNVEICFIYWLIFGWGQTKMRITSLFRREAVGHTSPERVVQLMRRKEVDINLNLVVFTKTPKIIQASMIAKSTATPNVHSICELRKIHNFNKLHQCMKSERIVLFCGRNGVEQFMMEISINIFEVDCEVQITSIDRIRFMKSSVVKN